MQRDKKEEPNIRTRSKIRQYLALSESNQSHEVLDKRSKGNIPKDARPPIPTMAHTSRVSKKSMCSCQSNCCYEIFE